jgi:hypothetical protein
LKWLAAEGDKIIDTVARGHAAESKRRATALRDAQWTSVDMADMETGIADIQAESRNRSNDVLLHFGQRNAKYGEIHTAPGYLAECSRTHPTYESAICYMDLNTQTLLPVSRHATSPVPFATTHLLQALIAVAAVFTEPMWDDVLQQSMTQFRLVTDQVRAQDGLPPIDWTLDPPGVSTA